MEVLTPSISLKIYAKIMVINNYTTLEQGQTFFLAFSTFVVVVGNTVIVVIGMHLVVDTG